ncbi:P-loop containing nucleoside triphosphate hydrolase protein [Microdochium bolleyi]|uniref:p-loop containing nucleoside triphosphate hydrolase protein n=1 Tax=Microdochium bolleyi TaxID=196109 RepID=A0A136IZF5_9PEZI|nr:P-loop containing nucleoside triphosphate hydrolase protein [Microdochium bolleyi]
MEIVYAQLTQRAEELLHHLQDTSSSGTHPPPEGASKCRPSRALVAIAGPPGSGKSTIADEVARRLNCSGRGCGAAAPIAAVVRMDGYHYSRAELDAFPDAREAHARRGAAWTFDADAVLALVRTLHASRTAEGAGAAAADIDISSTIYVPTFDHATKDPVPRGAAIPSQAKLVILEGNWLLYDEDPWRQISALVDESWFVDVEPRLARERVARRHVQSGIETNMADALARTDRNDVPNGEEVRRKLVRPAVRVWSIDQASREQMGEQYPQ